MAHCCDDCQESVGNSLCQQCPDCRGGRGQLQMIALNSSSRATVPSRNVGILVGPGIGVYLQGRYQKFLVTSQHNFNRRSWQFEPCQLIPSLFSMVDLVAGVCYGERNSPRREFKRANIKQRIRGLAPSTSKVPPKCGLRLPEACCWRSLPQWQIPSVRSSPSDLRRLPLHGGGS